MSMLLEPTSDGATYLQVAVILAVFTLIVLPSAVVILRDAARTLEERRRIKRKKAKIKEFERSIR